MKGIELPVNVLVIVAIAVIVLLGVVALYFIGYNPFGSAVGVEGAKNAACGNITRRGCMALAAVEPTPGFDANKNGELDGVGTLTETSNQWTQANCGTGTSAGTSGDSLATLCLCYYGRANETTCKQLCGCTAY